MKVKCPKCGAIYEIPDNYANKNVKCSKCSTSFASIDYISVLDHPKAKEEINIPEPSFHSHTMSFLFIILGLLGFIFSIIIGLTTSLSFTKTLGYDAYNRIPHFSEPDEWVIECLILLTSATCAFFSLVLVGIGAIIFYIIELKKNFKSPKNTVDKQFSPLVS